jgi:8-hydroxy-5-deazaflavin:NADPH oxidoreductase
MKIGIIGAGMIGGTTAKLFADAGYDVAISNSRGAASLQSVVDGIGPRARAMTVEEAARFGDVVLLAVPWRKTGALPPADAVSGKIVIDAMNPYADNGGFKHLAANGRKDLPVPERHAIFVAGDDPEAKRVVMTLIEEIGFGPVDTGSLAEGGAKQQPGTPIYNRPMTAAEAQKYVTL